MSYYNYRDMLNRYLTKTRRKEQKETHDILTTTMIRTPPRHCEDCIWKNDRDTCNMCNSSHKLFVPMEINEYINIMRDQIAVCLDEIKKLRDNKDNKGDN